MPRIKDTLQGPPPTQAGDHTRNAVLPMPNRMPHPMPPFEPFSPSPFLRCSVPSIRIPSPDSLRQFYRNSVAQTRVNSA